MNRYAKYAAHYSSEWKAEAFLTPKTMPLARQRLFALSAMWKAVSCIYQLSESDQ